jgi:hypothetical protein
MDGPAGVRNKGFLGKRVDPGATPLRSILAAGFMAVALTGCATKAVEGIKEPMPLKREAVNFLNEEPVITLYGDSLSTWFGDYNRGAPLPDRKVGPVIVNGIELVSAIQLLVEPFDIAVAPAPEMAGVKATLFNTGKRPLSEIVQVLCDNAGVFYHYDGRTLRLDAKRNFVARVPRIGESVTSIAEAVGNLGATDIHADPASGLLSFAADYRTHERLKEYMRTFENGRDMIVYDVWILEIKLDESSQIGVNWKSLTELSSDGLQLNFGMSSTTLASGLNLGLISEGDASSLEAVLQFLEEHGSAKTLARPTVTVMSGKEASFNVGESREYISEVTISTVLDDDDDDAIQVTTSTLETGLNVVFGGSHDNGIVHTDVSIEINNLIEFQKFSTTAAGEGTELLLPHTANRKYETAVDARPGDILVIGGLIQEAAEDGDTRIYGTDVPVSNSHKGSRSELVMMLRPRLVKIRPAEPKPHPIVSH